MVLGVVWDAVTRAFVFLCGGQVLLGILLLAVGAYITLGQPGKGAQALEEDQQEHQIETEDSGLSTEAADPRPPPLLSVSKEEDTPKELVWAAPPRNVSDQLIDAVIDNTLNTNGQHKPDGGVACETTRTKESGQSRKPLTSLHPQEFESTYSLGGQRSKDQENIPVGNGEEPLPTQLSAGNVKMLGDVFASGDASSVNGSYHPSLLNDGGLNSNDYQSNEVESKTATRAAVANDHRDASGALLTTWQSDIGDEGDGGSKDNSEGANIVAEINQSQVAAAAQVSEVAQPKPLIQVADDVNKSSTPADSAYENLDPSPLSPFAIEGLEIDFTAAKKRPNPNSPPVSRSSFGNLSAVEVFEAQLAVRQQRGLIPAVRSIPESEEATKVSDAKVATADQKVVEEPKGLEQAPSDSRQGSLPSNCQESLQQDSFPGVKSVVSMPSMEQPAPAMSWPVPSDVTRQGSNLSTTGSKAGKKKPFAKIKSFFKAKKADV